jgi:hypothetical protein
LLLALFHRTTAEALLGVALGEEGGAGTVEGLANTCDDCTDWPSALTAVTMQR